MTNPVDYGESLGRGVAGAAIRAARTGAAVSWQLSPCILGRGVAAAAVGAARTSAAVSSLGRGVAGAAVGAASTIAVRAVHTTSPWAEIWLVPQLELCTPSLWGHCRWTLACPCVLPPGQRRGWRRRWSCEHHRCSSCAHHSFVGRDMAGVAVGTVCTIAVGRGVAGAAVGAALAPAPCILGRGVAAHHRCGQRCSCAQHSTVNHDWRYG